MTRKKKLVILSIILVLAIAAVVIAFLCFGKPGNEPMPEPTDPTVATDPISGSTTPPTGTPTDPTDPSAPTDPSDPTDPTGTADPSAPTDPTEQPTQTPTQGTTQTPTQRPTQTPTQTPTQATTQKPTQTTSQPTTPSVKLEITTKQNTVIMAGDSLQLEYTYTGNKPLTWSTLHSSRGFIDQNGVITTYKTEDSGPFVVIVTDGEVEDRAALYVELMDIRTPTNSIIKVGDTLQIDYTFLGDPDALSWSSSDTAIFTVDNNGLVTGVGTGWATVKASTQYESWSINIYVVSKKGTASFDLSVDCPLYDGVTKFVGNYLQIDLQRSYMLTEDGQRNDLVDPWYATGDPSKPDPESPTRNYYITSSNPAVVSVANKYNNGFYGDYLFFNKAGTAVITFTSWDGYSESYTIYVKDDYDCAPGKTKLTPGEFAYYATMVGVEDGQEPSYQIRSYLYIWYDEDELTWETAKGLGHANAKRAFYLDSDTTIVVYAGFDESNGKHLFYHGTGEPNGHIQPYTPAKATSGKIRFPSKSISIMEKTLQVVEVLGDTRDEFVVYTSSDPSVVEASGSMLVTKYPGTAVITATYKGQTATMTVNVTPDPTIERITFEQDTYTVPLNDAIKLKYTYNGTSKLKWESSNENIAYIDSAGTLVPVGMGECTIRLRSVDEPLLVNASCKIIVTDPIDYPDATDIIFRDTSDTLSDGMVLTVGDVLIIDAYTVPTDSWAEVRCYSSDYGVISDNFGWDADKGRNVYYLVCQETGTVTITLSSSDGCVVKTYRITVKAK